MVSQDKFDQLQAQFNKLKFSLSKLAADKGGNGGPAPTDATASAQVASLKALLRCFVATSRGGPAKFGRRVSSRRRSSYGKRRR